MFSSIHLNFKDINTSADYFISVEYLLRILFDSVDGLCLGVKCSTSIHEIILKYGYKVNVKYTIQKF